MGLQDIVIEQQASHKYFRCNKQGCCKMKVACGPLIERQTMIQCNHRKRVEKAIDYQQVHLNFNYIPQSFNILENYLNQITEKNKLWKIRNTVLVVQAFSCNLSNINIISLFVQLTDLNIGQNPSIKSLKGIENCFNLRYLDCKNCDLENANELVNLRKLQELNLSNNKRLHNIDSLQKHSQLLNIYLSKCFIKQIKLQYHRCNLCPNATNQNHSIFRAAMGYFRLRRSLPSIYAISH